MDPYIPSESHRKFKAALLNLSHTDESKLKETAQNVYALTVIRCALQLLPQLPLNLSDAELKLLGSYIFEYVSDILGILDKRILEIPVPKAFKKPKIHLV